MIEKLRPKLEEIAARHVELRKQAEDPEVYGNPQKYAAIAREMGSLGKLVSLYDELKDIEAQLQDLRESLEDPELKEIAEAEIPDLETRHADLVDTLLGRLVLQDGTSDRDAIVEIRAGTGGDEAGLFAGDLVKMYLKFAETRGWKVEFLDSHSTDLGGYKEVTFTIAGAEVFENLRYESGTHRVQRVPETETQGRVHTSAATVAVLPEAEDVDVEIKSDDIRVDTYRAGGKGGQHVNKTESAVRITHLETGIVAQCQDEKSQHKNKDKAMRVLRARLFDYYQQQVDAERSEARKSQVGSGDRSQKIRTYNWPQNRVTDHRLGQNFPLEYVVAGDMEKLVESLKQWDTQQRLEALDTSGL